jgi:transcriptional regulator with XRE-family HTH domain
MTRRLNLTLARMGKQLSQKKLAHLVSVTPNYLSLIEQGQRLGSVELWDRLEAFLGIPQQKLREQIIIKEKV